MDVFKFSRYGLYTVDSPTEDQVLQAIHQYPDAINDREFVVDCVIRRGPIFLKRAFDMANIPKTKLDIALCFMRLMDVTCKASTGQTFRVMTCAGKEAGQVDMTIYSNGNPKFPSHSVLWRLGPGTTPQRLSQERFDSDMKAGLIGFVGTMEGNRVVTRFKRVNEKANLWYWSATVKSLDEAKAAKVLIRFLSRFYPSF
jgi:hypothetical protein